MGVRGRQGYRWKDLGELSEASACPTEASQTENFEIIRQLCWASTKQAFPPRRARVATSADVPSRGTEAAAHSCAREPHPCQPRLRISHDAQHSISLYCTAVLRLHTALSCWKPSPLARLACQYTGCFLAVELQPRLTRSNLECVILQGCSFAVVWAASTSTVQPQARPRAVAWFAAVLCVPTTATSSLSRCDREGSNAARRDALLCAR